ncbi:hypothetical protein A2U01_0064754, partial [Trifolium medium]|nr:hypothetical protein [Trifolium medium]
DTSEDSLALPLAERMGCIRGSVMKRCVWKVMPTKIVSSIYYGSSRPWWMEIHVGRCVRAAIYAMGTLL